MNEVQGEVSQNFYAGNFIDETVYDGFQYIKHRRVRVLYCM
jgi:hypothetical protein